ncbi:MAG: type II toxin-antitoxin system RelE/ParE family toxin [Bacteroidales bacterium]|nr:type II toxin-antitoxin system RelE/ParE family toxin [Bacteroidales bacterium]
MNYKFISYPVFTSELKRLGKKYRSLRADVEKLAEELAKNPLLGDDMGNGFRKIRMAISSKGRGKSGGARVITLNVLISQDESSIGFFYIYDKSEKTNITTKELHTIMKRSF